MLLSQGGHQTSEWTGPNELTVSWHPGEGGDDGGGGEIQLALAPAIPAIVVYGPPAAAALYGAWQTYMMSQEYWDKQKPSHGKTRTNGKTGKKKRFFEQDKTHGDLEVYDGRGRHKGSADPETGKMTKPPVPGRRIDVP